MNQILHVFMAKCYMDKQLINKAVIPDWLTPVQAGAALTQERVAQCLDCSGDNISVKNKNYCELTVLYWIWKNRLHSASINDGGYYGLFHYRRWLDLDDADISRLARMDVDAVLPYPTIHEPDIREHHERYLKHTDWNAMLQALRELSPEYYAAYETVFSQEYLYNYNILIAKAAVFRQYCEWLFPILLRVEELSVPKGGERADRYIGYIGENLLTLYFICHRNDFNIVHTGRKMLI